MTGNLYLATAGFALLALTLLAYNASVRFQRIKEIEQRFGSRYALKAEDETESKPRMIHAGLKGIRDAQRISWGLLFNDMPFTAFTSLEFALFKTYGIPTISSLLDSTGQLGKAENAARRFVDTGVLIGAMMVYPLPPLDLKDNDVSEPGDELMAKDWMDPRSAIALARTNYLHRRWKGKISNDDLLYTLSLFLLEPPSWIDRFEWRRVTELEKEALFSVWYHIGRGMGIAGIPDSLEGTRDWAESYEQSHMVYKPSNASVAEETIRLLLYKMPVFLHPTLKPIVISLLEDRLRESFGYEKAPAWVGAVTVSLLKARALFIRYLLPPRRTPTGFCPPDAMNKIIAGDAAGQFCPATGISAEAAAKQGKMCPVGSHMTGPGSEYDDVTKLQRMQPSRVENAPWYVTPSRTGSPMWIFEKLFVKPEDRRGAARWQSNILHDAKGVQGRAAVGLRLEECGPIGLELSGREEVLQEAVKLNGGKKLTGPWAFKPKVQPQH